MTATDVLRVIGTSYQGKEPFEYTADVLRTVVRATGTEYGFESCLTSRPFTVQTVVAGSPGAMAPGRGPATGAARAAQDMADGLAILATAGFRATDVDPADSYRPTDRRLIVAGPLRTAPRWAPPADRLVFGGAWRHVIIDEWGDDDAICLDPVVGGYTSVPRNDLTGPGVTVRLIEPPAEATDTVALARQCLRQGAAWRTAESGDSRDDRGLASIAANIASVTSGGAPRRLRLSLANYALHALRAGALLGSCGPLTTNQLALADLLHDVVTDCGDARTALDDHGDIASALHRLARTVEAVSELYRREATGR